MNKIKIKVFQGVWKNNNWAKVPVGVIERKVLDETYSRVRVEVAGRRDYVDKINPILVLDEEQVKKVSDLKAIESKQVNIDMDSLTRDYAELLLDGDKYISVETTFQNANVDESLKKEFKTFTDSKSRRDMTIFEDIDDFAKKKDWVEEGREYTYNQENNLEKDFQYYTFKDSESDEYYCIYLKHVGVDARVGFEFYTITSLGDYQFDEDVMTNFSTDAVDYTYNYLDDNNKVAVKEQVAGSMWYDECNKYGGMYYRVVKSGVHNNFMKNVTVIYIAQNLYDALDDNEKNRFKAV